MTSAMSKRETDILRFSFKCLSFFLTVLALHCCLGFSPVVASGHCSLAAVHGLLIVASHVAEHGLQGNTGFSSCGSQTPEHSLSTCGARAQLLHDMWDLPRSETKPVSPALADGFFTSGQPRKPILLFLMYPQWRR